MDIELKDKRIEIQPLAGKLLVQRIEAETVSPGGIMLVTTTEKKPQKGKVINVGEPGLLDDGTFKLKYAQVKKGDMVIFANYAGLEITVGGKEYLIMDESEIVATYKE